jgi:flagellin-like protein
MKLAAPILGAVVVVAIVVWVWLTVTIDRADRG